MFKATPEASIEVVTEVNLREIGRIDQILVQQAVTDGTIIDFNVLEIMACSTTSTGYVIKSFDQALRGEQFRGPLRYGINYRQVLSRMAIQALSKIEACEQWNVHMIWARQDVLYDYMTNTTMLDLPLIPVSVLDEHAEHELPALLLFIYRMIRQPHGFELVLGQIRGGTARQFTQVMRPRRTPEREAVVNRLRNKIRDGKSRPLSPQALAQIAEAIMEDQPDTEND